jgi:Bacterial TSP3 repeat
MRHHDGANFGWMDFGDGTPANGIQYQNNSATDCGVNHDGLGNLSGYAYGANIGWINFGWTTTSDVNRPRVNLLTGAFSGYAYSANMGWINLGTGNLVTNSMAITDTDGDGIADAWEQTYFANFTTATATSDSDGDGSSDKDEYIAGTDPENGADYLRIISHTYNGGMTQATVVFTTDPTRLYRLETSDNLGLSPDVWTNSAHGTFAPDAGTSTTKIISWPGTTRKFIRAVAVRPLP